jgi:phosphoesterase RecJ-like protein
MSIIRVERHAPLKRIGNVLREAKSVLVFVHVNIDGDTIGCAMAVTRLLRRLGKTAWIVLSSEVPAYLRFLCDDGNGEDVAAYCTEDPKRDLPELYADPDVCLAVDCSDERRFGRFTDLFFRGKTVAIDHHATNTGFASMNHVDDRSATGEIIYRLFRAMGETPAKAEAEALYTAIVTDTGRFQYGSVNAETLRITARLYDCGIDQQAITVNVYQSDRPEKVALHTRILNRLELLEGGRVVISTMPYSDLAETGATVDETEGVVEDLRNMKGVEVACFIRESKEGGVKVSLRSKQLLDVAAIAFENGGGGHLRASGFNAKTSLAEETEHMRRVLAAALKNAPEA